ncbi:uncharacterized protein ARMOST_12014 [Armillaria ostoyae]|uniref:Uncharacterized protein n=1 Tax=Armillaria ostoyae TaxID=47428 RepID=A0A284RIW6_ARMOS|nr:uncharacterized protein ARMOST_12014 [Armillaria ostoyae]
MYLYIALYDIGMTGAYHWALVPTSDKRFTRSLKMYQINNPNGDSFWELAHTIEPNLAITEKFNCCVRLPSIDLPISDIHAFLEEQDAEQGETPLLSTHLQRGWTCAQWCIRILSELVETGFLKIQLDTGDLQSRFYQRVLALGMLGESPDWPGDTIDGIRVIDYDYTMKREIGLFRY